MRPPRRAPQDAPRAPDPAGYDAPPLEGCDVSIASDRVEIALRPTRRLLPDRWSIVVARDGLRVERRARRRESVAVHARERVRGVRVDCGEDGAWRAGVALASGETVGLAAASDEARVRAIAAAARRALGGELPLGEVA